MKELDNNNIPEHVAIIMDGNGRWAKQQNKLRILDIQTVWQPCVVR